MAGGSNHAGGVGQILLGRLGDGVDKVQHGLLLHAVHKTMVKIVADLAVVNLVLQLDTHRHHHHHVGILGQHLAHGGDEILGVLIRHLGVGIGLGGDVPRPFALLPVFTGNGRVHGQGPQHRHTHLTADIQQAAHILQIVLLDARHVAVLVKDHALTQRRALVAHNIKSQSLEVVDLAVDIGLAVLIQADGHPAVAARLFGVEIVARQAVTQPGVAEPGVPDTLQIAVTGQNLLDAVGRIAPHLRGLVRLGGVGDRRRRGTQHAADQQHHAEHRTENPRFVHILTLLDAYFCPHCTVSTHFPQVKIQTSYITIQRISVNEHIKKKKTAATENPLPPFVKRLD